MAKRIPAHRPMKATKNPNALPPGQRYRRKWYQSTEWRQLRAVALARSPRCQCGKPATVLDHVDGHPADWEYLDPMRLHSLWVRFLTAATRVCCARCHGKKRFQREQSPGSKGAPGFSTAVPSNAGRGVNPSPDANQGHAGSRFSHTRNPRPMTTAEATRAYIARMEQLDSAGSDRDE